MYIVYLRYRRDQQYYKSVADRTTLQITDLRVPILGSLHLLFVVAVFFLFYYHYYYRVSFGTTATPINFLLLFGGTSILRSSGDEWSRRNWLTTTTKRRCARHSFRKYSTVNINVTRTCDCACVTTFRCIAILYSNTRGADRSYAISVMQIALQLFTAIL